MAAWIARLPVAAVAVGATLVTGPGSGGAAPADPSGDLGYIRPLIDQTLETEKSGIEIRWSNPTTGHDGMMRVERTFFRDQQPCRDYLRTVERPGRSGFVIRGTACRTGRAAWSIQDEIVTEKDARPGRSAGRGKPPPSPAPVAAAAEPGGADAALERAATALEEAKAPAGSDRAQPAEREPFVRFTLPSRTAL